MRDLKNIGIKVSGFRCYGEDPQGLDSFPAITVIIGRNNSGKSSLTEAISKNDDVATLGNNKEGLKGSIVITQPIDDGTITRMFPSNRSGGDISGNHFEYGSRYIGKRITARYKDVGSELINIEYDETTEPMIEHYARELGTKMPNPFRGLIFKKISAERDIQPEKEDNPSVRSDGAGATQTIQAILSRGEKYNRKIINMDFKTALNDIFGPENKFTDFSCTRKEDGRWEVILSEASKDDIPLSRSGSGLKTVILVLLNMLVIPYLEGKKLEDYVFIFEELENNLHPGLQRKLLDFITKLIKENGSHLLLTTHSSVVVDYYSNDVEAQIVHVYQKDNISKVEPVIQFIDSKNVLADLDFRASDLLMSNSIIWLEGPSDRIYLNKMISVWSDGLLQEGRHYQCLFYGGSLASYLSADAEAVDESKVQIFKINPNAIFITDRDRGNNTDPIPANKQRILNEIASIGGYGWVSAGREIENYIPFEVLKEVFSDEVDLKQPLGLYEDIKDYLDKHKIKLGSKFESNKPRYASLAADLITKEYILKSNDLPTQLDKIVKNLLLWNNIASS